MCGVKVMDISFYNIGSEDWNQQQANKAGRYTLTPPDP
jgi:hypothetical protein